MLFVKAASTGVVNLNKYSVLSFVRLARQLQLAYIMVDQCSNY